MSAFFWPLTPSKDLTEKKSQTFKILEENECVFIPLANTLPYDGIEHTYSRRVKNELTDSISFDKAHLLVPVWLVIFPILFITLSHQDFSPFLVLSILLKGPYSSPFTKNTVLCIHTEYAFLFLHSDSNSFTSEWDNRKLNHFPLFFGSSEIGKNQ